jgi:DNA-binding phage protein
MILRNLKEFAGNAPQKNGVDPSHAYLEACFEEANGDAAFIAKALGV